jgi:hypothetical protein
MTSTATFGELLRHLRKRAGLAQGELAAAGFSVAYICSRVTMQARISAQSAKVCYSSEFVDSGGARQAAGRIIFLESVRKFLRIILRQRNVLECRNQFSDEDLSH